MTVRISDTTLLLPAAGKRENRPPRALTPPTGADAMSAPLLPPEPEDDAVWLIRAPASAADDPRDAELQSLRARLSAAEAELAAYRDARMYDALMSGPAFKGWNRSQLDRARRITEASLPTPQEPTP